MFSIACYNKRFRSINRLRPQNWTSKLKLLDRLKLIIERNYNEPIKTSMQPIEHLDYLASKQEIDKKQNDDELDVVFIDDEEDQ